MNLYAAGSNGSGQLSLAHLDDVTTFTEVDFHPSIQPFVQNSQVLNLVSSSTHALLLLRLSPENGSATILLGAGTNTVGQLGPKCLLWENSRPEMKFKPVDFLSGLNVGGHDEWEARNIAVTWTTSLVVYRRINQRREVGAIDELDSDDDAGREEIVVSCGSNDFGELGRKDPAFIDADTEMEGKPSDFPSIVDLGLEKGERVELIRGGQRHVLALISRGRDQRVVGWGANRKGELDVGTLGSDTTQSIAAESKIDLKGKGKGKATSRPPFLPPTVINLPIPPGVCIVDLQLGASHSLAMLDNGSVLAWGHDNKGQISGISLINNVVGIAATWGGSYILRKDPSGAEELLSQGANTYCQLLRPAEGERKGQSGKVHIPEGRAIKSLVAGSEHLLIYANEETVDAEEKEVNELWVGGWNEHGNLGLGDKVDRPELTKVDIRGLVGGAAKIKGMWGGCGSTWLLLE